MLQHQIRDIFLPRKCEPFIKRRVYFTFCSCLSTLLPFHRLQDSTSPYGCQFDRGPIFQQYNCCFSGNPVFTVSPVFVGIKPNLSFHILTNNFPLFLCLFFFASMRSALSQHTPGYWTLHRLMSVWNPSTNRDSLSTRRNVCS